MDITARITTAQLREIYVALRGTSDGEIYTPDTVRGIKWITPANTRNALVRKGLAAQDCLGSGRYIVTIAAMIALHEAGVDRVHGAVADFFSAPTTRDQVQQVWDANRAQLDQWGLIDPAGHATRP